MPAPDDPPSRAPGWSGAWLLWVLVPAALAGITVAAITSEGLGVEAELQLVAPEAARPGELLPVRLLLIRGLEDPAGPRLASTDVEVRLLDPGGAEAARAVATASVAGGAEGHLALPRGGEGPYLLVGVARAEGRTLARVERPLRIAGDAEGASRTGRLATELQRLELGPVEAPGPAPAPDRLDARVVGGACVPEAPCGVLIAVGEPAARVRLLETPALSVARVDPEGPTADLVAIEVTVRGLEAVSTLTASREGAEVARRRVRLPVALSTPALEVPRRVAPRPGIRATALGAGEPVIVDAFRDGRWLRTGTIAAGTDGVQPLPFPALSPGLWRLQARVDPFGGARAAVRLVVVTQTRDGASAVRDALLPLGVDLPLRPSERDVAWVAAARESELRPLPAWTSGLAAARARVAERRRTVRALVVGALVVGILLLGLLWLRRAVAAAAQAQRVLEATGAPELATRSHRWRTLLGALALVGAMVLALLAGAALLLARAYLEGG